MHKWLAEQQFGKEGMSYKNMVTELLTATGKTNENGAVNYVLAHLGEPIPNGNAAQEGKFNMVPLTSRTARLFMGVQIQCAQCHPHPFNKEWKQNDFWNTNAFFRQVDAPKGRPGGNQMPREMQLELKDDLSLNPDGAIFYEERNGRIDEAKPYFSLDKELDRAAGRIDPTANRRLELAKFVTSSKNLAKVYVNRMWAHFFGRGFTNPVDDFGPENEPSHPELLDELATEFAHYGYDPKRLIRWICNSDAYSLSSVANKTNDTADAEPFFSRMLLKAMTPEQLFESLMTATQADMFESKENRKKLRDQWMRNLTTNFGDDEGNEVTFNGTVVQALMMMNGGELNTAVSRLAPILAKKNTSAGIIDRLYLATLNRAPTASERAKILKIYHTAPVHKKDGLSFCQDLFWALLNSNEFILNH